MPRKTHTINPPHVVMDGAHGLKVKNRELQKGRVKSSKRLKYLPLFFVLTARLKRELLASSFNQIVVLEGIDVCIYIYTHTVPAWPVRQKISHFMRCRNM